MPVLSTGTPPAHACTAAAPASGPAALAAAEPAVTATATPSLALTPSCPQKAAASTSGHNGAPQERQRGEGHPRGPGEEHPSRGHPAAELGHLTARRAHPTDYQEDQHHAGRQPKPRNQEAPGGHRWPDCRRARHPEPAASGAARGHLAPHARGIRPGIRHTLGYQTYGCPRPINSIAASSCRV